MRIMRYFSSTAQKHNTRVKIEYNRPGTISATHYAQKYIIMLV